MRGHRSTGRGARFGLFLLSISALMPAALFGQDAPPAQQAQTELVFEREVFRYPSFERRNPFRPLVASDQGPRFEQLRLMGIIHASDPSESVATLGTSTVTVSPDGATVTVQPGEAWYLKVGQSIGNIRVVEIHEQRVVVEVEEFGLTERHTMQLQTRRLGGTP